jgi:hypothetical protein
MVKENREIDMARMRLLALLASIMTAVFSRSIAHHGYWPIVYDWWHGHRFSQITGGAVS